MSYSSSVRAVTMLAAGIFVLPGNAAQAQFDASAWNQRSSQALAAADYTFTLGSIYRAIDVDNPRVGASRELARAAAFRVGAATRPPDPRVQFGLMNYMLPGLEPDPALGMRQLQVMQMIPLPRKLSASGTIARERAAGAAERAAEVRWEERARAAMAFYELWSTAARIAIARETRRLTEEAAAVASSMYQVGEGSQSDVLRARVEIARMDEEIMRMDAMRESAVARLAARAQLPEDSLHATPLRPVFPESLPSRKELQDQAVSNRPMLAAAAADVRAAIADERLARSELFPDLEVGIQYGERRMREGGGTDRMGSLMIGASIPIFARSRQLRMRDESAAMRAMSEAELRVMQTDTRARVTEVYAEIVRARRLATLYRTTVLPQAQAAAASALTSYRVGAVDFMTVLDNRMLVNRYRDELVTLLAQEGSAWAELEMLIGRELVAADIASPQQEGSR
jgi:outer membrane protein, heavy metal efflux system